MKKKTIVIDGKEYILKGEEATTEVEESTEEVVETPEEGTTGTEDEGDVEAKVDNAAEKIVAKLGLVELHKTVENLQKQLAESGETKKASALLDFETLMQKDVSEMTANEKIQGFFQAMLQNNDSVLKALSEGKTQYCPL